MNQPVKKPQTKAVNSDTLLEQLRDVGRGIASTVKTDLVGSVAHDALASLFGTPAKSGDLKPGQPVQFDAPTPQQTPPQEQQPFPFPERWPMMRKPHERLWQSPVNQEALNRLRAQEAQVAQKIEEIRWELKALIATIRNVDREITQAVNEQFIDPDAYHLNFLDRLKTILKLMRKNLSDSASWLSVMRSRKKERRYWSLYKKKGTEFGLNPDRVVATQVG